MNQLERLTEKMTAEFDGYRSWLLKQPPEEILNHAYEYTTKENLLNVLWDTDLKRRTCPNLIRAVER